ncbi:MAG: serine hydrolase [Chitinophagales bacterium]
MLRVSMAVVFLVVTHLAKGQQADARLKGLDSEIENLLKAYNAVGLSVAIVENDKTVYSKGFGYRNLSAKLPVTENTIFPIGSITKSFTAALLGMMESEKALSLKDKPSLYLPKLQFYNDHMNELISIDDLLSHKSGIGNIDATYIFFPAESRAQLMPRLRYLKPNGPVKDSWIYSNFNYVMAGTIVEAVTQKSWERNIQDRIFTPLHMNSSSTSISEMVKTADYAIGYGNTNHQVQEVLYAALNNDKPGGAINSTCMDMANWMKTWLADGTFQAKEVLSKDFVRHATSMHAIDNGMPPESSDPNVYLFGYGYGWKVNSSYGHYKVHHGGNVSGFSSQLVMFPTEHLGIVVLTNQHNSVLPYVVADLIEKRMLKMPRTAWNKYPVQVSDIYTVSKSIKDINRERQPTHILSDYCGTFSHPGFGSFKVINENKLLFAVFPNMKFRLEHQQFDAFVLKPIQDIPQIMNPEFYFNFTLDNAGNVAGVQVDFQDEPVTFLKREE